MIVFKINKTDDYKNKQGDDLQRQESIKTNEVISFEIVHRYRIFSEASSIAHII